jgi:hypothetical protein
MLGSLISEVTAKVLVEKWVVQINIQRKCDPNLVATDIGLRP